MKEFKALVRRNVKLFFKDKGMLVSSLITPLILLVLYATFLANIYRDAFTSGLPEGLELPKKLIEGCVGGQLASSLLSVCCVTVAFCSNLLMVQDKVNGSIYDLTIAPVKKSTLALGYYVASAFSTLLICLIAAGAAFIWIACLGWYLSVLDVLCILLDIVLLVAFGTGLSSIIHHFLSTQGQMSAVGTIISAGYGFICGAYMPISSFSSGLQKTLAFLPGTYGTSLFRNHYLRGVFQEMSDLGLPMDAIVGLRDSVDCNLYFFGNKVEIGVMYLVLGLSVVLLTGIYVLIHYVKRHEGKDKK